MSIINPEYLDLDKFKNSFHKNSPFPHVVLDNFLSDNFFNNLEKDKKKIDHNNGKKFSTDFEKNKWISKNTELPKSIKTIIDELNTDLWIKNISQLANIENVFTTKVSNTNLANYHEMKDGGYLGSHVDHSDDPDTGLPHVLNLLLYLSEEWNNEWGGSTLLFDKYGEKLMKEVNYVPNRAIIFLHTPYSFHGVKKINKKETNRKSIYVDYYSKEKNPYVNLELSFNKKWFRHGTYFVLPQTIDYFKIKNLKYIKSFLNYNLKKILFG